ncbi:MAG: leucine-rich repeat protein [Lachnospiraceae bacterium]|nr:leucine-rich repeat protein [Lachnospiraceae bacterium]
MRCQKCGAYIRDDSVFCNYCGEKVIVRVSKKETDEQPDRAVRPRDEDFDVAPTTPKNTEAEKTVPQKQSLWVILLILSAGVLFAVISVLLYQNLKKNQRTVINGQTTTESTASETEKPEESTEPQSESPEESAGETEDSSEEETESTEESTKESSSEETESTEESGSEGENESPEESSSEDAESTEESTESEGSDVEYGGMIYHISNGTATLSKCYSSDPVVELPDQVNGIPITAIGEAAFANCDHLKAIDIPEGVVTLGPYAFTYCRNLRLVVIPDSVTELGDHCFDNSGPLTFIVHEGSWGWLAAVNNNMNFLIGDSLNAGE